MLVILAGLGAFAVWRKVQADRAELDLWNEATAADEDCSGLVSDTSPVSLVCCDVLGAAAADSSVLERAFAEAIATQGVVTGTAAYVKAMVHFDQTRGWSPADVIRALFPQAEIRAQAASHP